MQDQDAKILRGAAIPALAVGVLTALGFAFLRGIDGFVGAALGSVVVLVFFTLSWVIISKASESGPTVMMGAAFGTYLVKIVLLGVLLVSFRETSSFDFQAFAWAILVCTLAFMAFQVRAFLRQRVLYVDPNASR